MHPVRNALLGAALALAIPAALAVAPVTNGTCRGGEARFFKDEGLALKVSTKLQFTKALMREKIDVRSNAGVISLSGNVSTADLVALAGRIASQVDSVVCVNNFLRVGPRETPPPLGSPG